MDVSKMLFDYRRNVADTIKTRGMKLEESFTDLAACFNTSLLIDGQHDSTLEKYFEKLFTGYNQKLQSF